MRKLAVGANFLPCGYSNDPMARKDLDMIAWDSLWMDSVALRVLYPSLY